MKNNFLFLFLGLALGAFAFWNLSNSEKTVEVPRHVKDAINAIKMGETEQGRLVLEENLEALDSLGLVVLADVYSLGKGGALDEQKAIKLARTINCGTGRMGGYEFSVAHILRFKDRERATRWLIRSAEAGDLRAIELLSSPTMLSVAGFELGIFASWKLTKPDSDTQLVRLWEVFGC